MVSETIRVTAHSVILKLGQAPDPTAPLLKDQLLDSNLVIEAANQKISTIGYSLTYAEDRVLHTVQVLLDETNYKGNAKSHKPARGGRYRFYEDLPVLEMRTADFLRAYGVKQKQTHRGKELSPQARRAAMNALRDLSREQFLLVYEKRHAKGSNKIDRIEDIATLITLDISNGGRNLRIIPNPILVDQIDSYFVLVPRNFFDLFEGKDPVEARFLEFLLFQIEMNRRGEKSRRKQRPTWEVRMQPEGMAWRLRLGAMVKARKWTELRQRLTRLYELGVKVGYLDSYQIEQEGTKGRIVDVLRLRNLVPSGAKPTSK